MRTALAVVGLLALGACVPTMPVRDRPESDRLRVMASSFCSAHASQNIDRVAALFVDEVADAIRARANAGQALRLTSGSGDCTPGQAAYWGGSRRFVEVRYANGSDTLDLWLSGEGLIDDIHFGDTGDSLRRTLGLRANVPPPRSLFD